MLRLRRLFSTNVSYQYQRHLIQATNRFVQDHLAGLPRRPETAKIANEPFQVYKRRFGEHLHAMSLRMASESFPVDRDIPLPPLVFNMNSVGWGKETWNRGQRDGLWNIEAYTSEGHNWIYVDPVALAAID